MPNLLSFPFKRSYPAKIRDAARKYIYVHAGTHPDEFNEDIRLWEDLRRDGVGGVAHVNRVDSIVLYHAHLISIMAKFPDNIGLDITYGSAFETDSDVTVTLKSLAFERASVIYNLAALFSQLGAAEDRSNVDGIKKAANNYQLAAGALSYLETSAIPKMIYSPDDSIPRDLAVSFARALKWLMLAQAQECSWQLARMSQYKNSLVAKIAAKTASLYRSSVQTILGASPATEHLFPPDWQPHIEAKSHHFTAVAELRKSMDDVEASRYGLEVARLGQAFKEAKMAHDVAKRGNIAPSVIQDALAKAVQRSLVRAERDNDLIYHEEVPSASALPPIPETNLVNATVPAGLLNPLSVLKTRRLSFEGLIGWGTKEAINIYNERKHSLVKDKITDASERMQDHSNEVLRKLNLPSSLEALERPIGLPPSLLKKAEEVRMEQGPSKIEASIEDIQRLAQRDLSILDEAMDILDSEASEDETAREGTSIDRPFAHEANKEFIEKERQYRSILQQALASDEHVRQKWDEWENRIVALTSSEAELEASVPSSTITSTSQTTLETKQTTSHARSLRIMLEKLDVLLRDRDRLISRAKALADVDDIRPRILKVASGFERMTEVRPAMFEDVMDEQLEKYEKFVREIADIDQKQNILLTDIEACNALFLQSRIDDPSVKAREHALQSLEHTYFKYKEITRNLEEGIQFYNDLAGIFTQFKEVCKQWRFERQEEIHALSRASQPADVSEASKKPAQALPAKKVASMIPPPANTPRRLPVGRPALWLPPLNSSEWEFE